ncbi:MAG: Crp/Fnr family transcriptional regulator [Pannonibacter sp.]
MIDPAQTQTPPPGPDIATRLGLTRLSPVAADLLVRNARMVALPRGTTVFSPGQVCPGWILVESGSVRVMMTADTGREILLYRVEPGESCLLTTSCLFGEEPYAATGLTETDVTALVLPASTVFHLVESEPEFRRLVFSGFGQRIGTILKTMEDAIFHRIEPRLARLLLARADAEGKLDATQADIASDLGSAREVIARHLGRLADEGILAKDRGHITILDRAVLSRLAAE